MNIDLDLEGKGTGKTATVEFMVSRWGRVRLLNEDKLPDEIRKKYGNTLLAAVVSVTGWEVVKTEQGLRLRSPNGIVEYEFIISLKDGRTGIPFRIKPFSGKREYGDLRNYIVSGYLEGATISVKINSVNCDLKNSELKEITRKVRHFDIYNLDGSQTLVYKTEPQPAKEKALYHEYETYQKLFIVKHLLPGKISLIKFSYSAFDAPDGMPWLPGTPAREVAEKIGGQEIPLPLGRRANADSFGDGFEVIVDGLPEPRIFENAPQPFELQAPSEKLQPNIGSNHVAMEQPGPGIAAAAGLPMKIEMAMPARQQEGGCITTAPAKAAGKGQGGRHQSVGEKSIRQRQGVGEEAVHLPGRGARRKSPTRPVPFSALSSFKAAIFDLDGVIVDSEMVHPRTFERALAKYGVKIENSHWKRAYTGIGSYAIFNDIVKRYRINEDARELVKRRNEIYLAEIRKNRLPVIEGFPEVHKLLIENEVLEAVASGGHINHVEESLRSVGLKHVPFVAIEQVKRGKPAPEIFLRAAKRLRVKPSECIVFEDSLSGVEAAAAAGMPCVALSTTMPESELRSRAALVVRDFRSKKLARLLTILLARRKETRASGKKGAKSEPRQLRGRKRK